MDEIYDKCPNCKSDDLQVGSITGRYVTSEEELTREIECNECGTTWTEVFAPSHTEDLRMTKGT